MKEDEQPDTDIPRSFWGWFPEFLRLGSHRIRRQARRLEFMWVPVEIVRAIKPRQA